MTEVADECEADLESRCPAARMPQAQGAMAIQELRDECQAPRAPGPSASPALEAGDD